MVVLVKRKSQSGHGSKHTSQLMMEPAGQTTQQHGRSIIIGLGNPLLTDDAVGPRVARLVYDTLDSPVVELCQLAVGGVELMETIIGYQNAVIIDAILTETGKPGACYLLDLARCPPTGHTNMSHEIGLLEGLELGRRLGLAVPDFVQVYAVKIVDPFTFGTKMTKQVERAIPRVVNEIVSEVRTQLCVSIGLNQVRERRRQEA
jgi:hydrogenase maturation protease